MKKITYLVIAILLFTVVFAVEDPVRIFAKNNLLEYTSDQCVNICGCGYYPPPIVWPSDISQACSNLNSPGWLPAVFPNYETNGQRVTQKSCFEQCRYHPQCFNVRPELISSLANRIGREGNPQAGNNPEFGGAQGPGLLDVGESCQGESYESTGRKIECTDDFEGCVIEVKQGPSCQVIENSNLLECDTNEKREIGTCNYLECEEQFRQMTCERNPDGSIPMIPDPNNPNVMIPKPRGDEDPCCDKDDDGFCDWLTSDWSKLNLNLLDEQDCDDDDPEINPDVVEIGSLCLDNIDNNCNDLIDKEEESCSNCEGGDPLCNSITEKRPLESEYQYMSVNSGEFKLYYYGEIRRLMCSGGETTEKQSECVSYTEIGDIVECLGVDLNWGSDLMARRITESDKNKLCNNLQCQYICNDFQLEWVDEIDCNPCEPSSSCPYLYSVTKDGLKLEEDIIVAQLFKFMEEPFYTKLNNYDASIGKLVIYEHLDELSHINQIELIKVEHPKYTEALIDSAGFIHTIKNPEKVFCVDNIGNDCTSMIEKQDAKLSIGSRETEFGELDYEVIIDSKSYGKEAWAQSNAGLGFMELELPQNDAKTGKLVIAFSYSGKNDVYEELYKKLAKVDKLLVSLSLIDNPFVESIFKEKYKDYFYRRIVIEYLNDGEWKHYPNKEDYNLHTLPYKKTVVPLDLNIIKENKIRIVQRESFVYDYIAVDFSDNEIISEVTIPLVNNDKLLQHDDKEILLQQDEFIELEFEKSKTNSENAVSYFLKSVGYYQPGVKK